MRGSTAIAAAVMSVSAMTLSAQQPTESPVQALGFGDFTFLTTELDRSEGFFVGQMAGHIIASLDEYVSFFGEVSLTGRNSGYVVELERAFARYDFRDALKISAGRFHTPVGYWNTAFHHGSWLQTSVARPEMIKFGGRFIPTHFVGVVVEGRFPASRLGLGYTAGVGNGRSDNIARPGDAGDVNGHRAYTAAVRVRPVSLRGLEVGGSFYADRIPLSTTVDVDERIVAAHLAWSRETPEVLAEYAYVNHDPESASGSTGSHAFYAQVAYRLPQGARAFKPYLRVERLDPDDDDLVFGPLALDYEGVIAGVRYDPGASLALRAELRSEEFEGVDHTVSLYLQASFVLAGS